MRARRLVTDDLPNVLAGASDPSNLATKDGSGDVLAAPMYANPKLAGTRLVHVGDVVVPVRSASPRRV